MPAKADHLDRAAGTEALLRKLDFVESLQVDWAIVMLFYSALHYVDSVLAVKNQHPRNHDARDTAIENHGTLTEIYKDYRRLKDGGRAARYDCPNYHKDDFDKFDVRFKKIKEFIVTRC